MEAKPYIVKLSPEVVKRLGDSVSFSGSLAGPQFFSSSCPEKEVVLTASEAASLALDGWSIKEKSEPKPQARKAAEKE